MKLQRHGLLMIGLGLLTGVHLFSAAEPKAVAFQFNNVTVELIFGNIVTQSDVDAIVNAGNPELSGGAGVTGAIWKAAGPELDEYIKKNIPADKNGVRCPIGQVCRTPGFNLKWRWIIHAVGPRGTDAHRAKKLHDVYHNIFNDYVKGTLCNKMGTLVMELPRRVLAIPMISTGIYGYPREEAARIAVDEVIKFSKRWPSIVATFINRSRGPITLRFVFFDDENGRASFELYKELLNQACSGRN